MKKILSLGVAAAVASLTAVAASAAIKPELSEPAVAGGELVVNIVANDYTAANAQFGVETTGLTLVGNAPMAGAFFNASNMQFAWAGVEAPANGTVMLALTFTVDAAADEEVSVKLVSTGVDEGVDFDAQVLTVVDPVDTSESDIVATTDESVVPTSEETSGIVTPDTVESSEETSEETKPAVPDTGIALAVIPAVLAGAAVVVAKKRK